MSKEWVKLLLQLSERGAPDALVRQIADMGEHGEPLSYALMHSNENEWASLVEAWEKM